MRYLTVEEILLIHEYELQQYGGSPGIRSIELLESATYRPKTSFGGTNLYKTVFDKAASLIYSIIKNHPFIDGNKRTGMVAGLTFLKLNNYTFNVSQNRLINIALDVVNDVLTLEELGEILRKHSAKN